MHYTQAELAETPIPIGKTLPELLRLGNMQRPAPDAVWVPVQLPDLQARKASDTSEDARTQSRMRWYRLHYDRPGASTDANDPRLGLYIPRVVSGPLSILMRDGVQWRVVYQSNERWREEWNRPVLVELPHDAAQHIEIVIGCSGVVERGLHMISTVWIGPLDALRWRADWRSLLQLQAPMATSLAILIVGLFALGVWWRRRRRHHDQAYLYFAVAAVVWGFRNLHYYIDLPRDSTYFAWFWWATHASLSWVMLLVYRFALRFDGRSHRGLELGLLWTVVACSLLTLPAIPRFFDVLMAQHLVNALVSIIVTVYMTVLWHRGGGPELRAITLASWIGLAFGWNDLQLVAGRMNPETIYLLPYAPLVVFGSFLYATLRRYVQAIEQVEGANEQLEARLRQREAELQANHERLRSIEREQALLLERERLMADMHDGIGSTLMSSLIMLEQGQLDRNGVANVLRECVDDLRLVIDSLEPIENDLSTLLATLRYRLGRRLEVAGVSVAWAMEDLPRLSWLSPPDALQVLRLLQEVLTNVLKHARAQCVQMSARLTEDGRVEVRVQDDGCGFDAAAALHSGGRGLSNLRLRARQLRGELQIDSAPGRGTAVRLLLPVERPTV